jgi:hypothetical protein
MTNPAERLREIASNTGTRPKLAAALQEFADYCEVIGVRDMEEAVLFAVGMIAGMHEQAGRVWR